MIFAGWIVELQAVLTDALTNAGHPMNAAGFRAWPFGW